MPAVTSSKSASSTPFDTKRGAQWAIAAATRGSVDFVFTSLMTGFYKKKNPSEEGFSSLATFRSVRGEAVELPCTAGLHERLLAAARAAMRGVPGLHVAR